MLVVGLTGGIASGKSTVAGMLREAGVPVICADELARDAVLPGSAGLAQIRIAFGEEVLDAHGGLDRVAMARVVFNDAEKRKLLESIIHPLVMEEQAKRLRTLEREGHAIVAVDVPLLYEGGLEHLFDCVIVVYVPRNVQEARLRERDGLSPDQVRSRLDAQMPIEEKKRRADHVVDNSESLQQTRLQLERLLERLRAGPTQDSATRNSSSH